MYLKVIKSSFVLLLMTALFLSAPPTFAHNYHTSLTRIDYNSSEKSLEIEINLFNHDLEIVLAAVNKKRFELEKSKAVEQMLFEYLQKNFIVSDENIKTMNWVGMEIKADMTTAFIEIKEIDTLDNLKIKNKVFFESYKEQTNLVSLHDGEKKHDLVFKVGDDFKQLSAKN